MLIMKDCIVEECTVGEKGMIWLSPMTKEKGRNPTQSYDNALTPKEHSKKQSDNNNKTPPKPRLHNDCGPT